MKKTTYLLSLLVLAIIACEETEEVGKYDNWQARNEAFIDSLQNIYDAKSDLELLSVIDQRDKKQRIFYKKLPESTIEGNEFPQLTSSVNVFYRGMLLNEQILATALSPKYYTSLYKKLDVFDQNFTGDIPSEFDNFTTFKVSELISGWIEILQHMKIGERWEIYIPWKVAYGSEKYDVIPGYSTLIFYLQLENIKN
ncbi:FKBP-type 22 kDa peptidyl-prolyl cis-trans isomerase [termite gut metagenome]|uniref:FKBP-type 22 kDa peptidyl-prolyl cis-trans isomerase n=1 Tax=termite gut metagenome TaxID=433724 RepID=A0A5J4QCQ5_9ZZZZ